MNPPNVVLICVDQWRGDALGCAGHPVVQTPYLDQLAGEGVRFSRAYSATPSCIPSRAALYTGLSQERHGRVGYQDGVPWDYETTLPGEFTRHGYQAQAIGKLHVFPERSQIGFQNVVLHDGFLHFTRRNHPDLTRVDDYLPWLRQRTGRADADDFEHGLNCNSQVARPWDKDEALHPTTWIVTEAIDFLRRRDPRKPFFLYLGFHRPHPPYDPPAWAFDLYEDAEMPPPITGDWDDEVLGRFETSHRADPSVGRLSPAALQRARAGYFGHMSHIDHQLNRFLETLDAHGLGANTVVCFVSDHGELLGDHGAFRKVLPYDGSARVPLLLKGPGIPKDAVVEDAAVELRDVMPTLLDAAGLPAPAGIDGRSALPLARGAATDWRPWLHGEHTGFGQAIHWLTDGREKFIWWSGDGREQLFDLVADPDEAIDLARAGDPRTARWRRAMVDALRGREEGFVDGESLVAGRPVKPLLDQLFSTL